MQDKPTIILHFKDSEKAINIRADHVVSISRMKYDGPNHYTAVEPQRGSMDMRMVWHIYDSEDDFERNLAVWQNALTSS